MVARPARVFSLSAPPRIPEESRSPKDRWWTGLIKLWRARGLPPLLEKRALLRNVTVAGAPPTARRTPLGASTAPAAEREVACDLSPQPWGAVAVPCVGVCCGGARARHVPGDARRRRRSGRARARQARVLRAVGAPAALRSAFAPRLCVPPRRERSTAATAGGRRSRAALMRAELRVAGVVRRCRCRY